jgi:hypothetical protein
VETRERAGLVVTARAGQRSTGKVHR